MGGRKRKTKKRRQKGGAEDLSFKKPMVSNVSAAGAIQGTMHKQAKGNEEMVELKKSMAGGAVVVPQMNQAGAAGNSSISMSIGTTLQGRADAEYDKDVYNKPKSSGMPGGGRKRRKKRKTKRKSKKSKKRRRKTKKRKKSKKRRRKSRGGLKGFNSRPLKKTFNKGPGEECIPNPVAIDNVGAMTQCGTYTPDRNDPTYKQQLQCLSKKVGPFSLPKFTCQDPRYRMGGTRRRKKSKKRRR